MSGATKITLRKSETKVTVHCARKPAPDRSQETPASATDTTATSGTRLIRNAVMPGSVSMLTRPLARRSIPAAISAGSATFTTAATAAIPGAIPDCSPTAREAAKTSARQAAQRARGATRSAPRARPSAGQITSAEPTWRGSAAA